MSFNKIIILNKVAKEKSADVVEMVKDYIDFLSVSLVEVMEYEWLTDLPQHNDARYIMFVDEALLANEEKLKVLEDLFIKVGKENFFIVLDDETEIDLEKKYAHLPIYLLPDSLLLRDDLDKLFLLDFVKEVLAENKVSDKKEAIYLAAAEEEYEKYRKYIRRELERRGYEVLPKVASYSNSQDRELSIEDEEKIFSLMKNCEFSIHFGKQETGDRRRKLSNQKYLENNIAYQLEKALYKHDSPEINTFKRIIWDFRLSNEAASDLEYVEKQSKKTEYLHSSIDQLKTFVLRILNDEVEEQKSSKKKAANQNKKLYFIYKKEEEEYIANLQKSLSKIPVEVLKTTISEDFDETRKQHEKALIDCDVCMILSKHINDYDWLNSKVHDLLKASGKRKNSPLVSKALVTMDDPQKVLETLDDTEIDILPYSNDGDTNSILNFINSLSEGV